MTELRWNDTIGAPATAAEARLELAAVCRLIAREGFAPIGAARLAARDPGRPGVYFANPGALLLDQITASNLIEVDRDGRHMGTGEAEPDSGALAMVLAALEAKPGAAAAAQIASAAGTVVAALEGGLQPITQTAFMFHGAIGAWDWDPAATPERIRTGIAKALSGEARAALIRGRGLLICAETLAQTWKLSFFLNKCCRSQIDAMAAAKASGTPLTIPSAAVVDHAVMQSRAFVAHPRFIADWPSFLDQLDREDPSYRD